MSPDWTPHEKGNGHHDRQPFRVPLLTWQSIILIKPSKAASQVPMELCTEASSQPCIQGSLHEPWPKFSAKDPPNGHSCGSLG